MPWYKTISKRTYIFTIVAIIIANALLLFGMVRLRICECVYVKVCHGEVMSSENSQHIADWYTLSHIIHGFVFYALMYVISRTVFKKSGGLPFGWWLIGAVVLEVGWEIVENSSWVIEYYRNNTVSLGYIGDSIINSVFDVVWMVGGFFIAKKFPIVATVTLAIFFELLAAYVIRDNLTLNILMFIHPFEAVKAWQTGL